jgi:predicted RNA-binding Zn ribbon-like protein
VDWIATDRYGLSRAPGGLALVQDLLNTVSTGRPREPDLLADVEAALAWSQRAMSSWASSRGRAWSPGVMTDKDLDQLVTLRADLRKAVADRSDAAAAQPIPLHRLTVDVELRADGSVVVAPRGDGWRGVAGALLLEISAAQHDDIWRRLKVCRSARCGAVFFDRSNNNSAVWHDARRCGNATNLQASRARRRAAVGQGGPV